MKLKDRLYLGVEYHWQAQRYADLIEAAKVLGKCWDGPRTGLAEKINNVAVAAEALERE